MLSGISLKDASDYSAKAFSLLILFKALYQEVAGGKFALDDGELNILKELQLAFQQTYLEQSAEPKSLTEQKEISLDIFSYLPEQKRARVIPNEGSLNPLSYEKLYGENEITAYVRTCVRLICHYQIQKMQRKIGKGKLWDARGLLCFFLKNVLTQLSHCDLNDKHTLSSIEKLLAFIKRIRHTKDLFKSHFSETFTRLLAQISRYLEKINIITIEYRGMISAREQAQQLINLMQSVFYEGVHLALHIPTQTTPNMNLNVFTFLSMGDEQANKLTFLQRQLRLLSYAHPANYLLEEKTNKRSGFLIERHGDSWQFKNAPLLTVENKAEIGTDLVEHFFVAKDFSKYYMKFLMLLEQLGEQSKYVILAHRLAGETGNWGIYHQLGGSIHSLCIMVRKISTELNSTLEAINKHLLAALYHAAGTDNVTTLGSWANNIGMVQLRKKSFLKHNQGILKICDELIKYKVDPAKATKEVVLQIALLVSGIHHLSMRCAQAGLTETPTIPKQAPSSLTQGILFCIQHANSSDISPRIYVEFDKFLQDAPKLLGNELAKQQARHLLVEAEFKKRSQAHQEIKCREKALQKMWEIKQRIVKRDRERDVAEKIKKQSEDELWELVIKSKEADADLMMAASAASSLCERGVSFSGRDLSGVRLPHARLNGVFERTKFIGADLKKVIFAGWMNNMDCTGAKLTGAHFAETTYESLNRSIYSLSADSISNRVYISSLSQQLCCDLSSGNKIYSTEVKGSTDAVFSQNKKNILHSVAQELQLCDLESGNIITKISLTAEQKVINITISPNGAFLAAAVKDINHGIQLLVWNKTGKLINSTTCKHMITCMAVSENNEFLVTGNERGELCLQVLTTGRGTIAIAAHSMPVRNIKTYGSRLFSTGYDGTVVLWRWGVGKDIIIESTIERNSCFLLIPCDRKSFLFKHIEAKKERRKIMPNAENPAVNPAITSSMKSVENIEINVVQVAKKYFSNAWPIALALSPDQRYILLASHHTLTCWKMEDETCQHTQFPVSVKHMVWVSPASAETKEDYCVVGDTEGGVHCFKLLGVGSAFTISLHWSKGLLPLAVKGLNLKNASGLEEKLLESLRKQGAIDKDDKDHQEPRHCYQR